jgi:alpha-glucosidase
MRGNETPVPSFSAWLRDKDDYPMVRERILWTVCALLTLLSVACLRVPPVQQAPKVRITAPPESLKADSFYRKHVSCKGIPILSSERVADAALARADFLMNHMLADREDIRKALIEANVRIVIIGAQEQTTDIPEWSYMKPKEYVNERARGFGGRVTGCGEENLLCLPVDRYDEENILIHEFAHAIHGYGLRRIDPEFEKKLKTLYSNAMAKGLWKNTYSASNPSEYWADAVQSFYDANRANNWNHNFANTREKLQGYDPDLAKLIAETFRHSEKTDWRYQRVAKQPCVTSPPKSLKCDPFYKKYVYCRSLPILASKHVSDRALLEANYLVRRMFCYRHDILKAMIDSGMRVVVIGRNERITDIPEYKKYVVPPSGGQFGVPPSGGSSGSKKTNEKDRLKAGLQTLRGLDYTADRGIVSVGEEDLLNLRGDPHAGESVLIARMAHAMHVIVGHRPVDPDFDKREKQQYELRVKRLDKDFNDRLEQLYANALQKGLWKNTSASRGHEAYWVEGVQAWFDCNGERVRPDGAPNLVNTREALEAYDPNLAQFIAEVFCHTDRADNWRYRKPTERQDE